MRIRKAVIPAAGLGTRFLPVTKAVPKELLPIVDIPMIQFIIEEAVGAGAEEILLITSPLKKLVEEYFGRNPELERHLEKSGKKEQVEALKKISNLCKITPIFQDQPLGLGHAVGCAERAVGNEPFAVILPDDMIDAQIPCTRQLADISEREGLSVIGVMEVPEKEVSKYGIVGGKSLGPKLTRVEKVVEKPDPAQAPSRLAIPGRYVLDPEIFSCLKEVKPGRGGEIQLTDGLEILAARKGLLAYQFEGDRYDTGDRLGYIDATLTMALRRSELKPGVIALLKKHLKGTPE